MEIKKTSVLAVIILTCITGGIYFPIWYLTRREAINQLHSSEKLGRDIFIAGIVVFSLVFINSFYSVFSNLDALQAGAEVQVSIVDLIADIASLIILIPLVYQTFKVKRILIDHYNNHLQKDIQFSNIMTLLFLNFYLQYKINRLD